MEIALQPYPECSSTPRARTHMRVSLIAGTRANLSFAGGDPVKSRIPPRRSRPADDRPSGRRRRPGEPYAARMATFRRRLLVCTPFSLCVDARHGGKATARLLPRRGNGPLLPAADHCHGTAIARPTWSSRGPTSPIVAAAGVSVALRRHPQLHPTLASSGLTTKAPDPTPSRVPLRFRRGSWPLQAPRPLARPIVLLLRPRPRSR